MKRIWGKIIRTACLLAVCCTGPGLFADQVELANGDTLTGQVVEQSERGVILKHPALGTLAIAQDRIKRVTIDPAATELLAQAQAEPPAQPEPQPQPAEAVVQADAAKVREAAETTAKAQPVSTFGWLLSEWKNKLTIGLNGAGGNSDRQNYYVNFDTQYEQGRDRWTANTAWFYGKANGAVAQNQVQSDLTRDWLQTDSPWFFFVKGQYKYDQKRNWENRTSAFGGGGYTLLKSKEVEVNSRIGFGGTYEFGNINDFTPEALFGGSVLQWKLNDRTTLSGQTTYYPSLEDSSTFRIESKFECIYKLDLAKGLSLKLGVENEYDSETPNDTGHNDLKYYGALVLSF